MTELVYNLSEKIKNNLSQIEQLRSRILLIPLSPKTEIRLKWEANIQRIFWHLSVNDNSYSKSEIIKLISQTGTERKINQQQKGILALNNYFSYLNEYWLMNRNQVTLATVKSVYEIAEKPVFGKAAGLTTYSEEKTNRCLNYLQFSQDHPVIQAGIAQNQLENIILFAEGNSRVARLLTYLFLYKNGYDFRKLLVLDEYYRRDLLTYRKIRETVEKANNLTLWLEYFSLAIAYQLEKALNNLESPNFQTTLPATFWKLNDRQKEVLIILEQPGANITNKKVQKLFGISQITASRDLTKLKSLGLLFPHGRGRSVYYTKV